MAVWAPERGTDGRIWIGLSPNQERGNAGGIALAMAAAYVLVGLLQGRGAAGTLLLALVTGAGAALASLLLRSSVTHLSGLMVSDDSLEVHRGLRRQTVPWSEITGFALQHRSWRGGTVVVLEGADGQVLPAPITARRFLPRLFADADFDAKLAFLRAHIPVADPGARVVS